MQCRCGGQGFAAAVNCWVYCWAYKWETGTLQCAILAVAWRGRDERFGVMSFKMKSVGAQDQHRPIQGRVQGVILRGGKSHPLHSRVVEAEAPAAIVIPADTVRGLQVPPSRTAVHRPTAPSTLHRRPLSSPNSMASAPCSAHRHRFPFIAPVPSSTPNYYFIVPRSPCGAATAAGMTFWAASRRRQSPV